MPGPSYDRPAGAFPDGFCWGAATSAHQVEGGNVGSDWWEWENRPGSVCAEPSGDACDHYHRYPDDLRLLASLGLGSYRFSVEWSRVEPEEGQFSLAALDHYRRVAAECLANGIDPVVTLHHFTSPRWLAADGGWHDARVVDRFARFCEQVVMHLGDLISIACTINEPNVVAFVGYRMGLFPPGIVDEGLFARVCENFIAAHRRSYEVLKAGPGDFPVGMTVSMTDYQAVPAEDPEALQTLDRIRAEVEDQFLEACRGDDYVGVQAYSRARIGPGGQLGPEKGVEVVPVGYEYWPEALGATVRRAWEVTEQVPVLVTENGLATEDDSLRVAYLRTALEGILGCLDDGVDVRGYICWSLLDNFEWMLGYKPRFGIVEVDRATQRRTVKPSGAWLGQVARANALV